MFLLVFLLFIFIFVREVIKTSLMTIKIIKEEKNQRNCKTQLSIEIDNIQSEIIRTKNHIDTNSIYCFKENVDTYYQILFYKTQNKTIAELQYMKNKMIKFYKTLLELEKISELHTTICLFR
jgi:hypothetical protein